jgi:hypothetical protein
MESQKAMLIVGQAAAGKTRRAKEEAEKRGGNYVVTFWDEIQTERGLANIMKSNPCTVIVEGLPVSALKTPEKIKRLVGGDPLIARGKFQNPELVKLPMLIFTMLAPAPPKMENTICRRFEVVEV